MIGIFLFHTGWFWSWAIDIVFVYMRVWEMRSKVQKLSWKQMYTFDSWQSTMIPQLHDWLLVVITLRNEDPLLPQEKHQARPNRTNCWCTGNSAFHCSIILGIEKQCNHSTGRENQDIMPIDSIPTGEGSAGIIRTRNRTAANISPHITIPEARVCENVKAGMNLPRSGIHIQSHRAVGSQRTSIDLK